MADLPVKDEGLANVAPDYHARRPRMRPLRGVKPS
jgi:hypothetical protein